MCGFLSDPSLLLRSSHMQQKRFAKRCHHHHFARYVSIDPSAIYPIVFQAKIPARWKNVACWRRCCCRVLRGYLIQQLFTERWSCFSCYIRGILFNLTVTSVEEQHKHARILWAVRDSGLYYFDTERYGIWLFAILGNMRTSFQCYCLPRKKEFLIVFVFSTFSL